MKIVQIIDTLSMGGAERMSVNIANTLAENGYESYLIATHSGGPLSEFLLPEVGFSILNKKSGKDIKAFFRLKSKLKKIKPEIVHAHSSSVFWTCVMKLFFPKMKILWHDHFGMSESNEKYLGNKFIFFSRWMDYVISVNEELQTWARNNFKMDKNKIQYIGNFPYLKKTERKETGENIIVHVANLKPLKDQITLIEASSIVQKQGIKFKVKLIGACDDKDWLQKVQSKIKESRLEETVEITGPQNDIGEILSTACIGVLCSETEGMPVSLLEYGLSSLPVVCTNVGQCTEVLDNGKYGWLVPTKSPQELANAIIEIITNKENAKKTGEDFYKRVQEKYGGEAFMNKYKKLITEN